MNDGNAPLHPIRPIRWKKSLDQSGDPHIRILVVDDHLVVREGFHSILRDQPGMSVVGLAENGEKALALLRHCGADVVLLDLHMPGMGGNATLLELKRSHCALRVIVLANSGPDDRACKAVEAGARGYLLKDSDQPEIIEAIRRVSAGECYLPEWISVRIAGGKVGSSLSRRELEILEMVSKGLTNKEIGRTLQVSHLTVRNHVRHILEKLHVGDRTEAATTAIQEGILRPVFSFPVVRDSLRIGPVERRE